MEKENSILVQILALKKEEGHELQEAFRRSDSGEWVEIERKVGVLLTWRNELHCFQGSH